MEEFENETEAEAGAGAEIKEQKKIIAKKFGCKIKNINFISEGGEGNIYSFVNKKNKNRIVKLYLNEVSNTRGFENIKEESEKQEELIENTRKTIKVLDDGKFTYKNKEIFYQIYDYMETDLNEAIYNDDLDPFESFIVALRSTMGICSMHKANVAHRDIKLENIMVNLKDKKTKIIDFGFSEEIEKNVMYDLRGTAKYLSPESFEFYKTGFLKSDVIFPSDIYALGITLFTMITKDTKLCDICNNLEEKIYNNKNITKSYINFLQSKKLEYIDFLKTNIQYKFLPYETLEMRERFLNLIKQMIDSDYTKRPTIEEVLKEMVNIYLDIQSIHKTKGFFKKYKGNFELKSREKILIKNYIEMDKLIIKEIDVKNIENKTLKKIKCTLKDKNITNNLKRHIKVIVNSIYNNTFENIKKENLVGLSEREELKVRKIENLLMDTKLAYCQYCSDKEKRKQIEINNEFLLRKSNFLKNLIGATNLIKEVNYMEEIKAF